MKCTAVRSTYFCLLFFWIAAGVAAAQEQPPSSAPATAALAGATITEWKGNIRLNLPGQLPSNPTRGEQLPPGTILDTGSGRLLLRLSDGSEVMVRAHTRLQVQQPSLTDPSYFQLLLGRIRALINKRTGGAVPFELGTPSAVIAVRGTQFEVEVNSGRGGRTRRSLWTERRRRISSSGARILNSRRTGLRPGATGTDQRNASRSGEA